MAALTIRGNKWYRHSQSKGGAPIDFVMEFFGKSFTEAVELLTGEKGAAPPPDRPSPAPISDFRLPPRSPDNRTARNYLTAACLFIGHVNEYTSRLPSAVSLVLMTIGGFVFYAKRKNAQTRDRKSVV